MHHAARLYTKIARSCQNLSIFSDRIPQEWQACMHSHTRNTHASDGRFYVKAPAFITLRARRQNLRSCPDSRTGNSPDYETRSELVKNLVALGLVSPAVTADRPRHRFLRYYIAIYTRANLVAESWSTNCARFPLAIVIFRDEFLSSPYSWLWRDRQKIESFNIQGRKRSIDRIARARVSKFISIFPSSSFNFGTAKLSRVEQ